MRYHLVLVTKYRRKTINQEMLKRAGEIFSDVLGKWRYEMLEFGDEEDHAHLLIRAHPALEVSALVNNLKTVSSRYLHSEFWDWLRTFDPSRKQAFWRGAYYVGTVGNASLDTVKRYIEAQGQDRWPPKRRAAARRSH